MSQASYTNLSVVYFSVFLYTNLVAAQKKGSFIPAGVTRSRKHGLKDVYPFLNKAVNFCQWHDYSPVSR